MRSEGDIEDILGSARVPGLRPGLREKVLAAAERRSGARRAARVTALGWLLAASVVFAVTLNLLAGHLDGRLLRAMASARPGTAPAPAPPTAAGEGDVRPAGIVAAVRRGPEPVDFASRADSIGRLLRGERNGI